MEKHIRTMVKYTKQHNLEVESRKPFNFLCINEIKGNNLRRMLPHSYAIRDENRFGLFKLISLFFSSTFILPAFIKLILYEMYTNRG